MAKILLVNPNKWGRGVTAIWIPAHVAVLRAQGHEVELFHRMEELAGNLPRVILVDSAGGMQLDS